MDCNQHMKDTNKTETDSPWPSGHIWNNYELFLTGMAWGVARACSPRGCGGVASDLVGADRANVLEENEDGVGLFRQWSPRVHGRFPCTERVSISKKVLVICRLDAIP